MFVNTIYTECTHARLVPTALKRLLTIERHTSNFYQKIILFRIYPCRSLDVRCCCFAFYCRDLEMLNDSLGDYAIQRIMLSV